MDNGNRVVRNIYIVLYVLTASIIFVFTGALALSERAPYAKGMVDLSNGWLDEDNHIINLDGEYIQTGTILHRRLPAEIEKDSCLCFESNNTNVIVWIDDIKVYEFESRENFTGMGYGFLYHYIGLSGLDAGKEVRIACISSVEADDEALIMKTYVSPTKNYVQMNASRMIIPCLLSGITVLFGLILAFVQFMVGNDYILPFSIASLSAISMAFGLFGLVDTNIIPLLTGKIYTARFLYMILPYMAVYPLVCFVNSITYNKRVVYRHAAFVISTLGITITLLVRFLFKQDLAVTFFRIFSLETMLVLILVAIILLDDRSYCKKHGVVMGIREIIPGLLVVLFSSLLDILCFAMEIRFSDSYSFFTRFGQIIFTIILMAQFFRWWLKDHEAIERDRFINRALQYAVSSNSPDESIKSMIAFLGKELEAKRFFIFEDQKNGKYRGTYEWFAEGHESAALELMYLPIEGLIDKLYEGFKVKDNRLIMSNPEEYRYSIPAFYNIIKTNNINNMILGPLEVGGHIFGICGVMDVPPKSMEAISDIINLISYFIGQLILQREEQTRSYFYNYNDVLSGAGNYVAYRKFVEEQLDLSSAFGFLRCDLSGLDEINITQGYEVGDQIVVLVARSLMEVFGENNVFRMNGTQFTAFGFEMEEIFFNNDVDRVKKMIKENGIEASIASVYCIYGTKDISLITKRVDDLLREEAGTGEE